MCDSKSGSDVSMKKKTWIYEDELKLLNAIYSCGYGNWTDISQRVPPYTALECEAHYLETFSEDFKRFVRKDVLCSDNCKIKLDSQNDYDFNYLNTAELNNYLKKLERDESSCNINRITSHNHLDEVKTNKIYNYMVALPSIGYNRIRSEFDIDYDNAAENILKMICENHLEHNEMHEDDSKLFEEMEFAICQSYNNRLKERKRVKNIMKTHCLLDRRKTFTMLQRLDVTFGRNTLKALVPVMRFLNGPEFDFLVERMKYQSDLKLKIHLFMEYRNHGLKFLNEIDTYKHLNAKRLKYNSELSSFHMPSNTDVRNPSVHGTRKPVMPLALGHLPGYNLLNEDEKKLCSMSRIVPETYNTFKELLITECEKYNGLRLAQARNLIKIDVNKTRKIYDYLMSINLIWQPQS